MHALRSGLTIVAGVALAMALYPPARAADDFVVGVAEPMSGGLAKFGHDARNATEMAFGEANAAAGVLGHKLVADVQDDRCNLTEAVRSTGLRLCGPGEWLVEKHGSRTRRSWRKLHLGVDTDTGEIVAQMRGLNASAARSMQHSRMAHLLR